MKSLIVSATAAHRPVGRHTGHGEPGTRQEEQLHVLPLAVDKKIVGPGYQEIAKKYAGDKTAEATLAKRIKGGTAANGGQKWGASALCLRTPCLRRRCHHAGKVDTGRR